MYDSVASPEESTFRACLLERCSAEENKIISGVETAEENMRGFAMFLAEIYTQLEDNQVFEIIRNYLCVNSDFQLECLFTYFGLILAGRSY